MSRKPLPRERFDGVLDLLDRNGSESETPRDAPNDPSWRADALGRSRHSRLASEVREPLQDADPERARALCAEVARDALGDFAPALLLLSADRRRRVQALAAWTVGLFDLALRPGLAGLDGDRLAQINAWEFRTEEALDGKPAGQAVFVAMASEEARAPWSRDALDAAVAIARRRAPFRKEREAAEGGGNRASALARALVEAATGETASVAGMAKLVGAAVEGSGESRHDALDSARLDETPREWRRATRYLRHALRYRVRRSPPLGLGRRLWFLALSFVR